MTTEFSTEMMSYSPRGAGQPPQRRIDIVRLIRLRLPIMVGVFAAIAIPSLIAVWLLAPREYTATEKIQFDSVEQSILGDGNTTSTSEFERFVNSFVNRVKDPDILDLILSDEKSGVRDLPSIKKAEAEDHLGLLQNGLSARAIPRSNLIEISATFKSPIEASTVVHAVAKKVAERASNLRYDLREQRRVALRGELDTQNKERTRLETNRKEEQARPVVAGPDNTEIKPVSDEERSLVQSALTLAQQNLNNVEAAAIVAKKEKGRVDGLESRRASKPGDPIYELDIETRVQADPQVQRLRNQEMALEQELSSTRYLPGRPELKAKEDQLKETKRRIEDAESKARKSILRSLQDNAELNFASAQEQVNAARDVFNEAQAKLDKQRESQDKLMEKAQALDDWDRQLAENRRKLDSIEQQLYLVNIEDKAPPTVKQVSPNPVPATPDRGNLLRFAAMAFAVAGAFGFLAGLVRELTDKQIRTSDDLTHITPLPVLASIPQGPGLVDTSSQFTSSHIQGSTDSRTSEEFRRILTRIIYPPEGAVEVKTILVTSPSRGDGKTSLACNLALALSEANRRVLVVDISARRPGVEKCLNLEPDHGLAEILAGEYSPEELVRPTGISNLFVLGPGFQSREVSRKLASREAVEFFEQAEQAFDHVIIDTPPCLLSSDAKLLAPVMDGVILVAGAGISTSTMVCRCLMDMQEIGGNVLGVVLNGVRSSRRKQAPDDGSQDDGYYEQNGNGKANGKSHHKHNGMNSKEDEELPMIMLVDEREPAQKGSDEA